MTTGAAVAVAMDAGYQRFGDGQVETSCHAQILVAAIDSIGLYLFATGALRIAEGMDALVNAVNALNGNRLEPGNMRIWQEKGILGPVVWTGRNQFGVPE